MKRVVKRKKISYNSLWFSPSVLVRLTFAVNTAASLPSSNTRRWAERVLSYPAVKPETGYSIWTTYCVSTSPTFESSDNDSQGSWNKLLCFAYFSGASAANSPLKRSIESLSNPQKQSLAVMRIGYSPLSLLHEGYLQKGSAYIFIAR